MIYFDTLYKLKNKEYQLGSPVFICETALIKDTIEDKILLRNIMLNVSNKKIKAVLINIGMKNIFDEKINSPLTQYLYQDLEIDAGEQFGNKISIEVPNLVRKIEVTIEKVILHDGEIWKNENQEYAMLQEQKIIDFPNEYLRKIERKINAKIVYYFTKNNTCWQCTCGQPNHLDNDVCSNCKLNKEVAENLLSEENLKIHYENYLQKKLLDQEERKKREEDRQKKEEEKNKIEKKQPLKETEINKKSFKKIYMKKKIGIISGITLTLILSFIFIFNRTFDKDITPLLVKSIENYVDTDKSGTLDNLDNLENVIKQEEELLKYDGKKFKIYYFQKYLDSIKMQKNSLKHYPEEDFLKMWDEGHKLRYNAVMNLILNNSLQVNKKTHAIIGERKLTEDIYKSIGENTTFKWDENEKKYYFEGAFENNTGINYNDVFVNIWFGKELNVCSIKEWKSGAIWNVKFYMDDQTMNSKFSLNLIVQIVKCRYKDIALDNTDVLRIPTNTNNISYEDILHNLYNLKPEDITTPDENTKPENEYTTKNTCEVDSCFEKGTHSIKGLSGELEYYCEKHYNELKNIMDNILN